MGKAEKLQQEQAVIRDTLYGDGYYCEKVRKYKYDNYILDNKDNIQVIDEVLNSKGIKLVVADTGSGKSHSFIERAKEMLQHKKDARVIMALPTRTLTLQVGNKPDVARMMGGDKFDESNRLIASTYEKLFEVDDFISAQKGSVKSGEVCLILDECHLLTTQQSFRKEGINNLISYIEKNDFDNVILVTATPEPMSLFRYEEIIQFTSTNKKASMDKVEIVVVDDAAEYIKGLDYTKEFPFIRWNNIEKINELIATMPQMMARITKDDKNTKAYKDIVQQSKIDANGIDGVLCTNVIEAGVNITDYPENIVPIAAFDSNNISVVDVIQFLNRFRRTPQSHVQTARVVIQRCKERELKASLLTMDGEVLFDFEDVELKLGNFYINDTYKMNTVADGQYKVGLEIGGSTVYRTINVVSNGCTDTINASFYAKEDPIPLMFHSVSFRPLIDIFKGNLYKIDAYKERIQILEDAFAGIREQKKQQEHLSDVEMDMLSTQDGILKEKLIKGVINEMGELSSCISYENDMLQVDNRLVHMVSFNQYQRQYYYNHELLRKELEEALGTTVVIVNENTAKSKHKKCNEDNLWEDIEDLRLDIINRCCDSYWQDIMGKKSLTLPQSKTYRESVFSVRGQEHIMELLQELDRTGIYGKMALQIITNCMSKKTFNQYKKIHKVIVQNNVLSKFVGCTVDEIPLISKDVKDRTQVCVFCYLEEQGQKTYTVTKELAQEIVDVFKKSFPMSKKVPTVKGVMKLMREMYQTKGADKIRTELRVSYDNVFKLVESDY